MTACLDFFFYFVKMTIINTISLQMVALFSLKEFMPCLKPKILN